MLQNVLESTVTVLQRKMSHVLRAKTEVHATRQSSSSSVTSRISRKITCADAYAGSQIACSVVSPKTRGPPLCSHRMCPCSSERLTLHLRTFEDTRRHTKKVGKANMRFFTGISRNQSDQVSESPTQHLQEDNTEGPNVTFFIVSFLGRSKNMFKAYVKIANCIGFQDWQHLQRFLISQFRGTSDAALHTTCFHTKKLEIFDTF